jgi:hypothetical protein
VAPHGEADAPAGDEHAVDLGEGVGRRAPDAPEAGDHVEGGVVPREGVHVAEPDVGVGAAVAGHGQ